MFFFLLFILPLIIMERLNNSVSFTHIRHQLYFCKILFLEISLEFTVYTVN